MAAISFIVAKDLVTPKLAALASPELIRRATLAAGTVLGSLAQRAFDEPGLRPTPWPQRKSGGSHPLLIKSHTLRQSIHVRPEGSDSVRVGTPVIYGAIHQLGSAKSSGRGSGVPARPFFPVLNDQLTGVASDAVNDALTALIGSV
jgi:phage gpG-like protein